MAYNKITFFTNLNSGNGIINFLKSKKKFNQKALNLQKHKLRKEKLQNYILNKNILSAVEIVCVECIAARNEPKKRSNFFFDSDNFNAETFFSNFQVIEYSPIKLEYLNLLTFLTFSIFLTSLIIFLSYFLAKQNPDSEKLSVYECGFEPYDDTRHSFDVKFCVIAILFVVFDIEIMFLIPWCVSVSDLNLLGIWTLIEFLFELLVGFFYVWYCGALDWDQKINIKNDG